MSGRGKRGPLSSAAVEREDALEMPGANSSKLLFLAAPIFRKELFIAPLAKYNSGMSWSVKYVPE